MLKLSNKNKQAYTQKGNIYDFVSGPIQYNEYLTYSKSKDTVLTFLKMQF